VTVPSVQYLAQARGRRELRRLGTMLFDQQMWCWGRDVVRPEGNLLCEYGFVRYRPEDRQSFGSHICIEGKPEQKVSTSGYSLVSDAGVWIGLWGWGMVYGNARDGGLFLRRFGFDPVWLNVTALPRNLHRPEDLSFWRSERDSDYWARLSRLFSSALLWIASYERWVIRVAGLSYREACVRQWFKEKLPASDMVAAWEILAQRAPIAYFQYPTSNDRREQILATSHKSPSGYARLQSTASGHCYCVQMNRTTRTGRRPGFLDGFR